jgi:single-strand DNA-binding protein
MAQLFGTFRIGNDPELRYLPDGTAVTNLSLASNYGKRDAATGRRETQWVDAVLWGKHAESVTQYLAKGNEVTATIDDPHTEEFQRHGNGGMGYKLTGRISNLQLVGGRPVEPEQQARSGQTNQQSRPAQQQQQRTSGQTGQQQTRPAQSQQGTSGPDQSFYDDDIPFLKYHHMNGM